MNQDLRVGAERNSESELTNFCGAHGFLQQGNCCVHFTYVSNFLKFELPQGSDSGANPAGSQFLESFLSW